MDLTDVDGAVSPSPAAAAATAASGEAVAIDLTKSPIAAKPAASVDAGRTGKGTGPGGCTELIEAGKKRVPALFGKSAVQIKCSGSHGLVLLHKPISEQWRAMKEAGQGTLASVLDAFAERGRYTQSLSRARPDVRHLKLDTVTNYLKLGVRLFKAMSQGCSCS